jgi:hypothetical protein
MMKKIAYIVVFSSLGLFSTWSALSLVAHIDWSRYAHPVRSGCWEIDHCDVAWYFVALFFSTLLLPTVIHAFAGWRLSKAALKQSAVALPTLWAGTLLYFVSARLINGY